MTITGNGQFQLFGIAVSTSNQIIVITLLTAAATVSAVSGVEKGIKLISGWNIRLMVILLGIFLLAGPSVFIGSVFFNTSARE
jgi:choline/glycine/proline betaine transport protein